MFILVALIVCLIVAITTEDTATAWAAACVALLGNVLARAVIRTAEQERDRA